MQDFVHIQKKIFKKAQELKSRSNFIRILVHTRTALKAKKWAHLQIFLFACSPNRRKHYDRYQPITAVNLLGMILSLYTQMNLCAFKLRT